MSVQLKEPGVCRIFFSSPFNGMEGEREDLTRLYWPQIQSICNKKGLQFVPVDMRWGITTEMSNEKQTVNICLREIDRSDMFVGFFGQRYGWYGEKDSDLQQSFDVALEKYPWLDNHRNKSVTELEFLHGHLNHPGQIPSVLCFRDKTWDDQERKKAEEKQDQKLIKKYASEGEQAKQLMDDLKSRVSHTEDKTLGVLMNYKNPQEGAKFMSENIIKYLTEVLLKDEHSVADIPLSQEKLQHDAFCNTRITFYIPSNYHETALNSHISKEGSSILVVKGYQGVGKTTLLCSWVKQLQSVDANTALVYHFVGSTNNSSDEQHSIYRIIKELAFQASLKENSSLDRPKLDKDIASKFEIKDQRDLAVRLKQVLLQASRLFSKVIIVMDGVEKIKGLRNAKPFYWLPAEIPPNVYFVMSIQTRPNVQESSLTLEEALHEKWDISELEVNGLNDQQKLQFCQEALKLRGKELSENQLKVVCDAEKSHNPLFLKIVLEELCMFGKFRELDAKIKSLVSCQSSEELFEKYLERMEFDYNSKEYPGNLVREVMCCLYVSRQGLSPSALMDILNISTDIWTPVYFGLLNYIQHVENALRFGYIDLEKAIDKRYFDKKENQSKYYQLLLNYSYRGLLGSMNNQNAVGTSHGTDLQTIRKRTMTEACYMAFMCRDQHKMLAMLTTPEILNYLATTDHRTELLHYIQVFNWSQEELIKKIFQGFDRYMMRMYVDYMEEDLFQHPDVRPILLQGLNALHRFCDFAHFHKANEKILTRIKRVRETYPKSAENDMKLCRINYDLAALNIDLRENSTAQFYFNTCLEQLEKMKGTVDRDEHLGLVASCYHGLGNVFRDSDSVKAEEYFRKSMDIHNETSVTGYDKDVDISASLSNIAWCKYHQGNYEEALQRYEEVIKKEEDLYFGQLPLSMSHTLTHVGIIYRKLKRYKEAEKAYKKALSIKLAICGNQHMDVAIAYVNNSNLCQELGNWSESEEYLKKALEVIKNIEMTETTLAWTVEENLSYNLINQGKYDEAFEYYPKIYKHVLENNMFDKSIPTIHYVAAQVAAFNKENPALGYEVLQHLIRSRHANGDHYFFLNKIARTQLFKDESPAPIPEEFTLDACTKRFPNYMAAWEYLIQLDLLPTKNVETIAMKVEDYYAVNGGYTSEQFLVVTCQHCDEIDWTEGAFQLYEQFRPKFSSDNEVILRNLAVAAINCGEKEKSLQCFEDLIKLQPDNYIFYEKAMVIKFQLNDISGASEKINIMESKFSDQPDLMEKIKLYKEELEKLPAE